MTKDKILEKIQNCSDRKDWFLLCFNNELPEDIIIEYKNFVNWNVISSFYHLSDDFILKFSNYLYLDNLLNNDNISEETKICLRTFL